MLRNWARSGLLLLAMVSSVPGAIAVEVGLNPRIEWRVENPFRFQG